MISCYTLYCLKAMSQCSLRFTCIALVLTLDSDLKTHSTQDLNLIATRNLRTYVCLVYNKIHLSGRFVLAVVSCGITFCGNFYNNF